MFETAALMLYPVFTFVARMIFWLKVVSRPVLDLMCSLPARQVLDEINDQTDQMEQIQQAMGQPIGSAADIDEDDLLNELEVLNLPACCNMMKAQVSSDGAGPLIATTRSLSCVDCPQGGLPEF